MYIPGKVHACAYIFAYAFISKSWRGKHCNKEIIEWSVFVKQISVMFLSKTTVMIEF